MKTILIGDVHGFSTWKQVVNQETFDRVVFIGDYFDSFTIKTEDQVNNFLDIVEYKKTSGKEVILLIGNHDHHYFVGDNGTSGYQNVGRFLIEPVLEANKEHLQMAFHFDNVLCTHAGVGETWLDKRISESTSYIEMLLPLNNIHKIADFVNNLWRYKPHSFIFDGMYSNVGDDIGQTPIWIRPASLKRDSQNIKKYGIIQVVGHTPQRTIDIKGKATGGKYYFIDTMAVGQYLIYEDGKFSLGTVNKPLTK